MTPEPSMCDCGLGFRHFGACPPHLDHCPGAIPGRASACTCPDRGNPFRPPLDFKINEYVRHRCQYRSHPNDVGEPESCGHPLPCPMHGADAPVVLPDGCVDGHSPDLVNCELGVDRKDPAEGSVLVRCTECGEDTGPAWVDPAYPLVPAVVHLPTGSHEYRWYERRKPTMTPPTSDNTGQQDRIQGPPALIAACDRICGVNSRYHKDRCPLYKANCKAMDAWNAKEAPRGSRS